MKTKITLHFLILSTLSVIILMSGCEDNVIGSMIGSVKGKITSTDYSNVTYGVSEVKIYLINNNFKTDSIDVNKNQKAFVDSATTDEDGNYKISGIKNGSYSVVPIPNSFVSIFSLAKDSKSYSFSIDDKNWDYTINITAQDPSSSQFGDYENYYDFDIASKNVPKLPENWRVGMLVQRYAYYLFIPVFVGDTYYAERITGEIMYEEDTQKWNINDTTPENYHLNYGFTCLFGTLSNKFRFTFFEVYWTKDNPERTYRNPHSFEYDLTLSKCPKYSEFQYDWKAYTFLRTK